MDERPFETLNVIPFVDIMLVLLTIVLTTANFIATGRIPIAVPQASHAQIDKQKDTTIEIDGDGNIYFHGSPVSKDELESELGRLPPETSLLIRAEHSGPFQKFVDVADILGRLHFTRVAVQTRRASK